jgi:hypothetical protein
LRAGVDSTRLKAAFLQANTSKEAQHGHIGPPPRQTITPSELATVVPLEQLWARLQPTKRQELLGHLTRMLAQRLAPCDSKEVADE